MSKFTMHDGDMACAPIGDQVNYSDLADGQQFSPDAGATWYVCAVPLFGNVAVYVSDRRDDNAPTTRVDVPEDGLVWLRAEV